MCLTCRDAAILLTVSLGTFLYPVGPPAAHAQQSGAAATTYSSDPPARLRVTTRLVQVNVVVNDKHGNPITGLTKNDFELLDNKKPQEIRVFSEETKSPSPASPVPLPANTYTNRIDQQEHPEGVTVILLDTLNTDFADQALLRSQLLKFVETLQPQDHVALYWLGSSGLRILHDFTSRPSRDISSPIPNFWMSPHLLQCLQQSTPISAPPLSSTLPIPPPGTAFASPSPR
jgi:3',5'-cyclic AMP phosphodiesterase CpdA